MKNGKDLIRNAFYFVSNKNQSQTFVFNFFNTNYNITFAIALYTNYNLKTCIESHFFF